MRMRRAGRPAARAAGRLYERRGAARVPVSHAFRAAAKAEIAAWCAATAAPHDALVAARRAVRITSKPPSSRGRTRRWRRRCRREPSTWSTSARSRCASATTRSLAPASPRSTATSHCSPPSLDEYTYACMLDRRCRLCGNQFEPLSWSEPEGGWYLTMCAAHDVRGQFLFGHKSCQCARTVHFRACTATTQLNKTIITLTSSCTMAGAASVGSGQPVSKVSREEVDAMCEALGYLEPKYKVRDHALPVVSARSRCSTSSSATCATKPARKQARDV